jgi:2-C-methyl-D-erythritol 4-phosphate cytidylyltransferase/2-C-methyl-D-erythritol 2,4-cyclodiphosphate synthase
MAGTVAIVVAAGSGERLGLGIPKAFVEVAGRPLLRLAVEGVARCGAIDGIIVAAPPDAVSRARELFLGHPEISVVAGGATRHASVASALAALEDDRGRIVCHDAARPFASAALFHAVLGGVERWDGCIPGIPVSDTIKRVRGSMIVATEPREELVAAQTPQAFRGSALIEAHERAAVGGRSFTDDAACLEWAGFSVGVVPGEAANVKITTAEDLAMAHGAVTAAGSRDG